MAEQMNRHKTPVRGAICLWQIYFIALLAGNTKILGFFITKNASFWDPDLGPRFGTPIWDPDLGPRLGTPIWDPDLGPRFETPIWDPDLGPRFGTPIWDPDFIALHFLLALHFLFDTFELVQIFETNS
jgi:hypothetical protein